MNAIVRGLGMLLGALALVAACGKSEPAPAVANAQRTTCSSDGDCVITTFSGCCAACMGAPKAMAKDILAQQQNRCTVVDCKPAPENVECVPHDAPESFVARCREGTCVSAKR